MSLKINAVHKMMYVVKCTLASLILRDKGIIGVKKKWTYGEYKDKGVLNKT